MQPAHVDAIAGRSGADLGDSGQRLVDETGEVSRKLERFAPVRDEQRRLQCERSERDRREHAADGADHRIFVEDHAEADEGKDGGQDRGQRRVAEILFDRVDAERAAREIAYGEAAIKTRSEADQTIHHGLLHL
jgi:hypothetical protein